MKKTIEQALEEVSTTGLRKLGSAMLDRIEASKEYINRELDIQITDYFIIGDAKKSFRLDLKAMAQIEDHNKALAIAAVAGGMCEMSDIIVKLTKATIERE